LKDKPAGLAYDAKEVSNSNIYTLLQNFSIPCKRPQKIPNQTHFHSFFK